MIRLSIAVIIFEYGYFFSGLSPRSRLVVGILKFKRFLMHHFSKKSFEKALLEDRLEPILKECVSPLEIAASTIYSRFLTEMFNHMQWLLNEQNVLPQLKNRTVEVTH